MMNQVKPYLLNGAVDELHQVLDSNCRAQATWADDLHSALGELATAIQEELQASENSMEMVGEINSDFQNAPVADRHIQTRREQLITLREKVHLLRAAIRNDPELIAVNSAQIRLRASEIHDTLEEMRHTDEEFLQTTLNTNVGAGE